MSRRVVRCAGSPAARRAGVALLVLAAALGAAGCRSHATKGAGAKPPGPATIYDWGVYQESLERILTADGPIDLAEERRVVEEQVAATHEAGLAVPPGVELHLGWLASLEGDAAAAALHFEAEKAAFPESAALVDRMLLQVKP